MLDKKAAVATLVATAAFFMLGTTKIFLALALFGAILGSYQRNRYAGAQCEPCLPGKPCPPCPSKYATLTAITAVTTEVLLLAGWLVARRRRSL